VVLEAVFEGTHTAVLSVPGGSIPAIGQRVAVPFASVLKVSGDRFTSFALYFDQIELLTRMRRQRWRARQGAERAAIRSIVSFALLIYLARWSYNEGVRCAHDIGIFSWVVQRRQYPA
jgi:hypothetical protein